MYNPYKTALVKIKDIKDEASEIKLFTLVFEDKKEQKKFNPLPGQIVEIGFPGFGEGPFAPCSCGLQKIFFQICVRSVGQLTKKLHKLKIGDKLTMRGPYGLGTFPENDRNLLLIAGGLGLAPLRPLIQKYTKLPQSSSDGGARHETEHPPERLKFRQNDSAELAFSRAGKTAPEILLRNITSHSAKTADRQPSSLGKLPPGGASFKGEGVKRIQLFYGVRSQKDMIFKDEYDEWKKYIDLHITLDQQEKGWKGHIGLITTLLQDVKIVDNPIAILCGPPAMFKFILQELKKIGVKDEDIYMSLERRMHCGVGVCQHCAIGSKYVCKDGPVFRWSEIKNIEGVI